MFYIHDWFMMHTVNGWTYKKPIYFPAKCDNSCWKCLQKHTCCVCGCNLSRSPVVEHFTKLVVTEHHLMPGTREDRSKLAAHQPRTQDANSHATLLRLSLPASALHVLRCSASYGMQPENTFFRSVTGHSLQVFGVPSPLHRDL